LETDRKAKKKAKMSEERQEFRSSGKLQGKGADGKKDAQGDGKEGGYAGKKFATQTKKSYKGKRNSPGAKMNNFRGERSLQTMRHKVTQKNMTSKK
jgi:hypothetical protein